MASRALAQGLALGFGASVLFALGLLMMKSRAGALPIARGRNTLRAVTAWIRDPVWIGGLAVQAAGYAAYMVALSRAPVSLMAVMMQGGIALFVLLTVIFLGERARVWEWLGIATFVAAALMLAASLDAGVAPGALDIGALTMASVAAIAVILAMLGARRLRHSAAATAIASGLAFGFGSLYTKALANVLSGAADVVALAAGLLASPYTYLAMAANVAGLVMLQNSFAKGRGIIAMPISSAISNLLAIAGGIAVFSERLPGSPFDASMRVSAFALTIAASAALAVADLGPAPASARGEPGTIF